MIKTVQDRKVEIKSLKKMKTEIKLKIKKFMKSNKNLSSKLYPQEWKRESFINKR